MNEMEYLDEWANDVIKWAEDKLRRGQFIDVQNHLEDVVTALIVATRPQYRERVLSFIKTMLSVIEVAMRRGVL